MTTEELREQIELHPKNQTKIGEDLGFNKSKMSRLVKGATIDESDTKLLRLYFYGEIPFEDIRPAQDLSGVLKFSSTEWKVIEVLAMRVGLSPARWIAEQVRTIIAFRSQKSPTTKVVGYNPANTRGLKVAEEKTVYGASSPPASSSDEADVSAAIEKTMGEIERKGDPSEELS